MYYTSSILIPIPKPYSFKFTLHTLNRHSGRPSAFTFPAGGSPGGHFCERHLAETAPTRRDRGGCAHLALCQEVAHRLRVDRLRHPRHTGMITDHVHILFRLCHISTLFSVHRAILRVGSLHVVSTAHHNSVQELNQEYLVLSLIVFRYDAVTERLSKYRHPLVHLLRFRGRQKVVEP